MSVQIAEVLVTCNFEDGKNVTFSVSPQKNAEIVSTTSGLYPYAAAHQMRKFGFNPQGTFKTPSGEIGWLLE